ncbi:hypothetical protein HC752_20265 [Vibrio sp. S9_S30]|uniref:hypothetical protein n=1 Tax=Vibrio sp. S9_S30 TaxID=2720226 RepID=UPI001680A310|nr:hypothetical protein [Vibrio sp. S9_S30]MBD1559279.1 hypothetical protein [Vibrio sp. S9_S30]
MSSKLSSLVWSYKAAKAEDKLLLLALAELADRKGTFCTSITELRDLTELSEGVLKTVLHHLVHNANGLVTLHKSQPPSQKEFVGKLNLGQATNQTPENSVDLYALAQQQNERLMQYQNNNKGKLSRTQKAQITPLNRRSTEKQYSVLEIHMEEIPHWAEGLMYKKGVHGRKDIWDSFVIDVHNSGEKIFTINQLTNRLHQKIEHYKNAVFSNSNSNNANRPAKQSALSAFEEKFQDYLNDDLDD